MTEDEIWQIEEALETLEGIFKEVRWTRAIGYVVDIGWLFQEAIEEFGLLDDDSDG